MAEDMNRWLRRVRPDTTADDGDWTSSPEADGILAAVHRQTDGALPPRLVRSARKNAWRWMPPAVVAAAAVVVVAVALTSNPTPAQDGGTFALPVGPANSAPPLPTIRPASFLLTTDSSCSSLLSNLRSHTAANLQSLQTTGAYYKGGLVFYGTDQNALANAAAVARQQRSSGSRDAINQRGYVVDKHSGARRRRARRRQDRRRPADHDHRRGAPGDRHLEPHRHRHPRSDRLHRLAGCATARRRIAGPGPHVRGPLLRPCRGGGGRPVHLSVRRSGWSADGDWIAAGVGGVLGRTVDRRHGSAGRAQRADDQPAVLPVEREGQGCGPEGGPCGAAVGVATEVHRDEWRRHRYAVGAV